LSQIRADLERAINRLGLDAVISESIAFPVNPSATVIENCIRVVKDRADIFVLIIGARYGSVTETGRSVTNLEYLEAKAKGIPIYVFVSKRVLHALPLWKANPEGDFTSVVDTAQLFQFIENVRDTKEHWMFEFEEAAHIEETLQKQFAYLFMESLALRARVKDLRLSDRLSALSGPSLRLLMEKPTTWEFSFFASVLDEEFSKNTALKWDAKYALKSGATRDFTSGEFQYDVAATNRLVSQKLADASALVDSFSSLFNAAIQDALGGLGVPGNAEQIAYVAQRLALIHRRLLEWAIDFNDVKAHPEFSRLLALIAAIPTDAIEQLESLPQRFRDETDKALESIRKGETGHVDVRLVLKDPAASGEIAKEYEKLEAWVASRQYESGD
jgi:hypothetical protein